MLAAHGNVSAEQNRYYTVDPSAVANFPGWVKSRGPTEVDVWRQAVRSNNKLSLFYPPHFLSPGVVAESSVSCLGACAW